MVTTSEKTSESSNQHRPFLAILALAVFFVGASEFMLSAMLGPLAEAFRTSPARASWLISGYAFTYAVAAPILGYLSDRIDRVRFLLFALLAFAIDGIGIAFSPTIEIAMVLRVFGGLASAVIIPTAFALVSEIVPRERQAGAMGLVMLGMTFGIALGPALAGVLTEWVGWRLPFLTSASGCVLAFIIGSRTTPGNYSPSFARTAVHFHWMKKWNVMRPLIAKGAWNGTGVAAFLLSGEMLKQRYNLNTAEIGVTVTAFGFGLGIGNLSAGWIRRMCGREEISLIAITALLALSIAAFTTMALPFIGAVTCLVLWGFALGAGAPSSTTILAERSGHSKGMVLAFAETLNNVTIFAVLPAAIRSIDRGDNISLILVLGTGLVVGIILTLIDGFLSRPVSAEQSKPLDLSGTN
ncbi:MFS transporter [Martelella lutilitoris]|uniref:MFS transporter n=1 Tax=Martelella lutilitoris TaxID=2583532 RepID=A0A7T7HI84_9HYPH|nr:MFS transporter [Martelella lutilitoris]QQM29693.1 MFS transporter [Martelella lutilitoris]